MYNLLRSDVYRLVRNRHAIAIAIVSLLIVLLSAGFLTIRVRTGHAVQLGLYSSESFSMNADSLPRSITQGLGQMLLGGNLYPLVSALLTCAVMIPDLRGGMRKRIMCFGRVESSYVVEKYMLMALLNLLLLGAMTGLYVGFLTFTGYSFDVSETAGAFLEWFLLVWMNTTTYSICVVSMLWGIKRLSVSLSISIALSLGLAGVLARWSFESWGISWAIWSIPYSVRQILSQGSAYLSGSLAGLSAAIALPVDELIAILTICVLAWVCHAVKRWS